VPTNKSGTDWFHEIFKPAFTQNHNLTVSGANDKNKYLFSLGYLNQQGTVLNTYLKRYVARINTAFSVNDHIRIGENLQVSYRDNPNVATQQGPNFNEVFRALLTQPILPVYDIKGGWAHLNAFNYNDNPVATRVLAKDNKANYWEIFGNAYAEAGFLTHFTARTSFGGSLTNYYSYNYATASYYPLSNGLPNNSLSESSGYRRSFTWTNTLGFSKIINAYHSIKAVLGTEAIDNYNREVGGRKIGFFTNDINYVFLSNGSPSGQSNYSFAGASTLFSLIGRVDYGYKDKYYLSGTLRRDGSSIFGPEKQFGWFPSVSAAWRITEEPFMKEVNGLTDLKLRASWGKTGYYGNTDPFNQYTLYGSSIGNTYYDINGTNNPVQGFRTVRLGEPNTGWQEDIVRTIGVESVFGNGKLSITADWYNKKASGLLFPVTLPDVLGGGVAPNTNVGIVENTGIDLFVNSKGKFSKDSRWDATFTLTTYHNNIVKLTDLPFYIPPFEQAGPFIRNEVGHPTSSFYGYKIIGIFKDAEEVGNSPVQNAAAPGRFKYLDANGDNKIDDADRVHFGNPNPKFTAGVNIGITYKNFDFSTFCYGSFGNDVRNLQTITDFYPTIFGSGITSAKSKAALYDSWTPQHTNTSVPIAENNINFSNLGDVNSYGVEKGSYFRNKSMLLGYTLPKPWLQKRKMEKLRVYVQVANLFTITKYTGLDPELSGYSAAFGIDFGNYPNNQRQYLFGLEAGF
jgi:TonB-linked SusC/RagA family outer membrane protein